MDKEKIKELLYFYSPWWTTGRVPNELVLDFKRPIIQKLFSYLSLPRIVIIKGPRRTGKTTIIYQMINELLQVQKVPPKSIVYLSFDDPELRIDLNEIISIYEEVLGKTIYEERQIYIFLDEIHFLNNWEFTIKKYFDRKYPIKFIVSGSSATLIRKSSESLAGRTVEEILFPFSFTEFLLYRLRDAKIIQTVTKLRKAFSFTDLPDKTELLPYQRKITIMFNDYLSWGGFPHIFNVNDERLKYKLLREDIIEKVIYRDLVELYGIKKPFVLEKLFLYLAEHSSEILNISNISNSLKLSREYVERYIDYLKRAYIVRTIRRYSSSIEKEIRCNEKCFLIDNGLVKIAGGEVPQGKLVETSISRHLIEKEIYYWRDKEEVDFVVKLGKNIFPIEVKYKSVIEKKDIIRLFKFIKKHKIRNGIVVSKDILEKRNINGTEVLFIPAWLFIMLVE